MEESTRPAPSDGPVKLADLYDASSLNLAFLADKFDLDRSTVRCWIAGARAPRKSNKEAYEAIRKLLAENLRYEFHPSYGYATADEIAELTGTYISENRDSILERIARRTANKGKN